MSGKGRPSSGSDVAVESVAGGRLSTLVADREPVLALGGRPVRPCLWIDLSLGLGLDPVISDSRRGVQRVGDVGLRESDDVARLGRVMGPDAGEAVRLKLRPHRSAL